MVGLLGELTEDVLLADAPSDDSDDDGGRESARVRELLAKRRTLEEVLRVMGERTTRLEDEARVAREEARRERRETEDARRALEASSRAREDAEARLRELESEIGRAKSERDEAKGTAERFRGDLARVREERNALRESSKRHGVATTRAEEEWRSRERRLVDELALARAEAAKGKVELEDLRRRCESAEAYATSVNARVTEAEREIDAFNAVVASDATGRTRDLEDELARAEETRFALERKLSDAAARAIAQEGEIEKLRVIAEESAPGVADLRARLDAMDIRERDLVAALKYEENIKEQAVFEMNRARAAAAKAEAYASRVSAKSAHSKALATVIHSLGDSLFED